MSDVTVRNATRDDAPVIADLYDRAADGVSRFIWSLVQDDYPGMGLLEIGAARFAREEAEVSYRNCLMADMDGQNGKKIAGMIHAYVMAGDGTVFDGCPDALRPFEELEEHGSYYISCLSVYPDHRNRGIGTLLMADSENAARDRGCPSLSLIVFDENEDACRLYERLGFSERMRRAIVPHPLIEVEGDAILLVKPLN